MNLIHGIGRDEAPTPAEASDFQPAGSPQSPLPPPPWDQYGANAQVKKGANAQVAHPECSLTRPKFSLSLRLSGLWWSQGSHGAYQGSRGEQSKGPEA